SALLPTLPRLATHRFNAPEVAQWPTPAKAYAAYRQWATGGLCLRSAGIAALPQSAKGGVKAQTTISALYLGSFWSMNGFRHDAASSLARTGRPAGELQYRRP